MYNDMVDQLEIQRNITTLEIVEKYNTMESIRRKCDHIQMKNATKLQEKIVRPMHITILNIQVQNLDTENIYY